MPNNNNNTSVNMFHVLHNYAINSSIYFTVNVTGDVASLYILSAPGWYVIRLFRLCPKTTVIGYTGFLARHVEGFWLVPISVASLQLVINMWGPDLAGRCVLQHLNWYNYNCQGSDISILMWIASAPVTRAYIYTVYIYIYIYIYIFTQQRFRATFRFNAFSFQNW